MGSRATTTAAGHGADVHGHVYTVCRASKSNATANPLRCTRARNGQECALLLGERCATSRGPGGQVPSTSLPVSVTPAARAFLAAVSLPVEQRPPAPPTLVVAAHPDDEVLGAGGQIEWLAPAVYVAHLTPGVPIALDLDQRAAYNTPHAYGVCRARELDAVLGRAGIPPKRRFRLGGADQRCARMLERLARELRDLLCRLKPAVLLTHAYEGGHPDHDASAFAAQTACRLLSEPPARLEFTSYHGRGGRFECASFLPNGDEGLLARMDEGQRTFKRALMAE